MGQICVIGLSLSLLFLFCSSSETDIPVVCGGFIRSKFQADFTKIKVNLYSMDGTLKYSTDCAPNNGYFLLPLYDQGEYLVRAIPPGGWMITPNEVPLIVEEAKDPCSSGKDIYFQLVGFQLEGQVTSGDNLPGPKGVEITLLPIREEDEREFSHVHTAAEGRFILEAVPPGNYLLTTSHPLWKTSEDPVMVTITDSPVIASTGLKVLGYDIKGEVRSGGEPVEGVFLFLFTHSGVEINCSLNTASPISPKLQAVPTCSVTSDSAGAFLFYPLPPGDYSIIPYYQREQLQFEVHPTELNFTVSNDSMILSPFFEVQGFSITGKVLLTREGPPIPGARVSLGSDHFTTTDDQGQYRLMNITTGTYTLEIAAPNLEFDAHEVHISPATPSLLPVSPNRYLVYGEVIETVATSTSEKQREIQVFSTDSRPKVIATAATGKSGAFSLYLPLGEYNIKVMITPKEAEEGLLILPEEQFVAMLSAPLTSKITFTQFLANISGTITCIEQCPDNLKIRLVRIKEGNQELSAQVSMNRNEGKFNFTDVLPGAVKVSLNHSNWCWKSTDISCVIVKGSQAPLRFIQTGYSMKYDVSHRIFMHYYQGNDSANTAILTGKGSLCLEKSGIYYIKVESCHKFKSHTYEFNTSSPAPLILHSIGHSLIIPIHTEIEDSSLLLNLRSTNMEKILKPNKIEKVTEKQWIISFTAVVKPFDKIEVQPQSSVLMFSPPSLLWIVGEECPETVTAFQGSPGEVIEGRVEPALVGVMVRLDLGSDGHVTTHTNESGYYRAGPVRSGDHIEISVVLDGYTFEPLPDKYSFKAVKLCHVSVQVSSNVGRPLAGVLVSISGANFRQNMFTNDEGNIIYHSLDPEQYFIKPFLREFEFTPSSLILNLIQGQTEVLSFVGKRVAFSCSGLVATINRQPLPSIVIRAHGRGSGEECASYSETTTSDSKGLYRFHGLLPGCLYNVSVKYGGNISHILPSFRSLMVIETDVEKLDFLLLFDTKSIYISGWINADLRLLGTLKVGVFIKEQNEESPLQSVTVDGVGFFDFMPLSPLLEGSYLILLETSLSVHSYKYSDVGYVVSGEKDTHISLKFEAQEIPMEKETQSRGSILALLLVVLSAFAIVNYDKVLSHIQSYANSIPASTETSDSRQRKTVQRSHKK